MTERRLLALPGDGIGPEIVDATCKVLTTLGPALVRPIAIDEAAIGFASLATEKNTVPNQVIDAAKAADGVILGPVSHNDYPSVAEGGRNPSGVLRRELELFANIRPARTYDGLPPPGARSFDLVIVRENLEGFYADRNMHAGGGEFMPEPGVALALRKITANGSRRIAESAFRLARQRPGKHVTAIHKANVMRLSDGLFLETVQEVASQFPDVRYDALLVDAAAAHLVRHPDRFDVVLTTNMFGDILSDLASELAGGLGLAGSLNVGDRHAVAQAQHGSAPDIAGQDRANPTSLILSVAMLLRHLDEIGSAGLIENAIKQALADPTRRTKDLGGKLGTRAFTDMLCDLISDALP